MDNREVLLIISRSPSYYAVSASDSFCACLGNMSLAAHFIPQHLVVFGLVIAECIATILWALHDTFCFP